MGLVELQKWLIDNNGFKNQFEKVVIDSVVKQFPVVSSEVDKPEEHDWHYLLMCASLLAQSDREQCQDAALRIAQHCLQGDDSLESEKDAAAVILDMLANQLAIELAERRKLLKSKFSERLPFLMTQEHVKRSIQNSVVLSNNEILEMNKFQRLFWDIADKHDWISMSAPTSAGKSYIILRWIAQFIREKCKATIIYIVPTSTLRLLILAVCRYLPI